jgi:lipopolysaccharide transport system ATP-binding protein
MIRVHNLTKIFKLYNSPADRLKEIVSGRRCYREFTALQDLSFTVAAGETLGIIGQNGAGKSTLLKLLMGILIPDNGEIAVDGKISGLLELTIGFNPEFTGIQNIYMNGTLRGLSKQEIDAKREKIIAFSELEDFINEPIKTYSSGMILRLAFATAIHDDPQAFVVDEALSVGDAYFQQKCIRKLMEFKEKGVSIVFVSHDLNSVKLLSDKALLLDHGQIADAGEPDKVISTYNYLLAKKSEGVELRLATSSGKLKSYGNFKAEISAVTMLNTSGQDCEIFISGEKCIIQIFLKAQEDIREITAGILIQDRFGQDIFGTNTHHLKFPLSLKRGENCIVEYTIEELNIGPGKYTLSTALHTLDTHVHECYHWADFIKTFEVVGSKDFMFIGLSKLKPAVLIKHST